MNSRTNRSGHLGYLPLHIAFTLIQNLADKKLAETRIKSGFSWSEDNFGVDNCLFSNAQHKKYNLQPKDLKNLDGEVAIAVRGLAKIEVLGNEVLRELSVYLTEVVRNNASIDWTIKESVRAKLKVRVKRALRKFGYPPDMEKLAIDTVLKQAELMAKENARD